MSSKESHAIRHNFALKLPATLIAFLTMCVLSAVSAAANTYVVRPDGTGDFVTIQGAIDAVVDGDVIELADGVFVGDGNRDVDFRGKAVTVRSQTGDPELCIIDCQGTVETPHRGFAFVSGEGAGSTLSGVTIMNGFRSDEPGSAIYCLSSSPTISDCVLIRNIGWYTGWGGGGALSCEGSSPAVSRCSFRENEGGYYGHGGALSLSNSSSALLECSFFNNYAGIGGAIWVAGSYPTFTRCLVNENRAHWGGAMALCGSQIVIDSSTMYSNYGGYVNGIWDWTGSTLTLTNTIIASTNNPISAADGSVSLTCCNLWGNPGGDWIDGYADQYDYNGGIHGNMSVDPLFLDAAARDFRLRSCSPCLSGECGQIGAFGHGAWCDAAGIKGVTDVGNDQGRRVRIRWVRSGHDSLGEDQVTAYALYRRQDQYFRQKRTVRGPAVTSADRQGSRLDGWDYVTTVPARGDEFYQTTVPTNCDSTVADGMCFSVFMVSAMTSDPFIFYDSAPDSGYSVDNLAPGAPGNLHFSQPTTLAWDQSADQDFDYFTVYGSANGGLDSTAVALLTTTSSTADLGQCHYGFFHVTATDFSGNVGMASGIENPLSDVAGDEHMPRRFGLLPIRPNPADRDVLLGFELPSDSFVELVLIDVTGRVVVELVGAGFTTGRHNITWDRRDAAGSVVPSGVYFCRLTAGGLSDTDRLLLLHR
jgi:hypothetical protein